MKERKIFGTKGDPCWCGSFRYNELSGDWENVPQTTFTLAKCSDCLTIRTITCEYDDYEEGLYSTGLSRRHRNSIDTIEKYCSGKVLDIGCNCGEILNELKSNKKFTELVGIDFNNKAIELGIERFGLKLKNSSVEDILLKKNEKYDSIIMIHAFEHILKPVQFLRNILPLFKDDGSRLLYLCVPNIENAYITRFGALDPREHYWHFSESTLITLVKYAYPDAEIIFSGKSHIWSNNEQLEMVVKIPSLEKSNEH
jgi:ubiquinone/menaquinone biosynthesis C-methylase UbiE